MIEKEITKKKISKKEALFKAKELYKSIIDALKKQGYIFAEKEQKLTPTQYGEQTTYTILGFKTIDTFAKVRQEVSVVYENLVKTKVDNNVLDKGNLVVNIKGLVIYDYENQFEKAPLQKFMFNIYQKYLKKEELKKKYVIPLLKDTDAIYKTLKEKLELYQ